MQDKQDVESRHAAAHVAVILILSSVVLFWKLPQGSLLDWDEANYACVSKTLLKKNDFLGLSTTDCMTSWPYFWFEKPPLFFLMQAQVYRLLGVSTFSSRMLGAAFGVGCVLLAYFIGSLLFDRKTAFFASLILLASPQFAHESRQTMLDVPTTFFILLAAYFLIRGRQKNLYVALAGGAAGLAVLTKFYTGLLSLLLSLLIILLAPKEYLKRKKSVALFFLAFTLIALPWHLLQYQMHGETFIENYFIKQSFGRFAGFEGHDYGRLFYAKVLQKGLSPWMPALPLAVPVLLAFDGRKRKETLTLALWSTLIFVFFSYSRNQLPWYIVYVYPMASIVSARFFAFIDEVIERAGTLIFLAFLITALSLPKVLDCNPCYKAISGISSEYPILVHDSSPRTPGSVFYLGGKRKTTEEILEFEKENGFFIAAVGDAKLFPKATKIFEGQSVVVVVRGLSKEEMLKVFERLHTHDVGSGVCYPYMPPNL